MRSSKFHPSILLITVAIVFLLGVWLRIPMTKLGIPLGAHSSTVIRYVGIPGPSPITPFSGNWPHIAKQPDSFSRNQQQSTTPLSKEVHNVGSFSPEWVTTPSKNSRFAKQPSEPRFGNQPQINPSSEAIRLNASFAGTDTTEADGIGARNPPDPHLAVGPNNLVLTTNDPGGFAIMDKTGKLIAKTSIYSFYRPIARANQSGADPKVIFDPESGRFFILAISGPTFGCSGNACVSDFLFAVSKSSSPTTFGVGDWYLYAFDATLEGSTPTNTWADFPTIGVNSDLVVLTGKMLYFGTGQNAYPKLRVLNKSKLIRGEAVTWIDFVGMRDPGNGGLSTGFRAALHYGPSNAFFLVSIANACGFVIWGIDNTVSPPTLTARSISSIVGGQCLDSPRVPQPGTGTVSLFPGGDGLMCDVVYRNGSLWTLRNIAMSFGSGDVAAIRWYQIGVSDWPASVKMIQESVFGEDGKWSFFAALAVDAQNNLAMIYARGNSNEFASLYISGRFGTDPPNTLRSSLLLKAGTLSYNPILDGDGRGRYGDYFGAAVDPSDQSIWFLGEYAKLREAWGTWVGKVSFCPSSITPTSNSFGIGGGTGSVSVKAPSDCSWSTSSSVNWISINLGNVGTGDGIVNFTVAPNPSQNARTGTLSIGGQSFTVTQSGENPVPALAGLTPNSANAGAAAFTLTVNGTGFVNGAMVRWNGNNRTTAFVSATQLTAQIPASDLLTLGPATITVFNPAPGGGTSTAQSFNVMANVASISAASFSGAELAADAIVAAFGSELATQTLAAPVTPLPTTLAGTTVRVRDSAGVERPAPLFFVAAGQVNYLMPAGTAAGAATVTITSGSGKLSLGAVRIAAVAPGLFTANANGQGVPAAVALRARGEVQSFEPVARFDSAAGRFVTAPIDLGPEGDQVILLLFGTGIRGRSALAAVMCTIGGVSVPVSFAGVQGDLVGLDQLNVGLLPRALAGRGEVDLVLTVDGRAANTVRINIK
jgi:uncharacterized protein (TIGR03437 family)